ncbi:MAG: 50S ribosomal protein L23 [Flavobacteriales bacterium]|jgi:large subunit ribosomal protein L23|nr:50S ribosomal protein L23 [Flavobacteriales bacterium]|tara:strand:- start:3686 stop:3976 length:291 start_codon:yes stop_codon:yes gene_type:complete
MDILVKPILTEKATNESELRNSYTFIVSKDANKIQIKKAIEESYGVSVIKVRTMIYGAQSTTKHTKRGVQASKKGAYKKALVKISEGDRIDFFSNL